MPHQAAAERTIQPASGRFDPDFFSLGVGAHGFLRSKPTRSDSVERSDITIFFRSYVVGFVAVIFGSL